MSGWIQRGLGQSTHEIRCSESSRRTGLSSYIVGVEHCPKAFPIPRKRPHVPSYSLTKMRQLVKFDPSIQFARPIGAHDEECLRGFKAKRAGVGEIGKGSRGVAGGRAAAI